MHPQGADPFTVNAMVCTQSVTATSQLLCTFLAYCPGCASLWAHFASLCFAYTTQKLDCLFIAASFSINEREKKMLWKVRPWIIAISWRPLPSSPQAKRIKKINLFSVISLVYPSLDLDAIISLGSAWIHSVHNMVVPGSSSLHHRAWRALVESSFSLRLLNEVALSFR